MNQSDPNNSQSTPKAPAKRQWYKEDFKREAVKLVADESYTFKTAAHALGISEKSIRDWWARAGRFKFR